MLATGKFQVNHVRRYSVCDAAIPSRVYRSALSRSGVASLDGDCCCGVVDLFPFVIGPADRAWQDVSDIPCLPVCARKSESTRSNVARFPACPRHGGPVTSIPAASSGSEGMKSCLDFKTRVGVRAVIYPEAGILRPILADFLLAPRAISVATAKRYVWESRTRLEMLGLLAPNPRLGGSSGWR